MKIVVLCGGLGMERDVSITSGTLVAIALRERGHNVLLIDSYFGYPEPYKRPVEIFTNKQKIEVKLVGELEPDLEAVKRSRNQAGNSLLGANVLEICGAADITFFALHGDEGENGKLQATFDVAGIKYTGSGYLGSAIAMNKSITKQLLAQAGVLTPPFITIYSGKRPYADVGFPCVVKPCSGGSSVGTSIVNCRDEYDKALEMAFKYERAIIVEKYIKGRELTVGILGSKALPVIEIIPKEGFYDYKNKYQAGLTTELCPAPIGEEMTERIQQLSKRVHDILMIETYSRVDFLADEKGDLYCLEANTLPGMTPTSLVPTMAKASGMSYDELCEEIIFESMKKYNK